MHSCQRFREFFTLLVGVIALQGIFCTHTAAYAPVKSAAMTRPINAPVDPAPVPELDQFWQNTLAELATVPMHARIEKVNEALPYRKYKVTLSSLNGVSVSGFLSLPVRGEDPGNLKPWPVIVTACGYGGRQQGVMLGDCMRGFAILQVFPRGQGESDSGYTITGGDKLTMELDRPEGAYYQGAYADVIRMIDYVMTRKDLDSSRIALVATSQGAGIALAVAALDPRVRTVVAHVPFLCNMPLAATMPSLVKHLLDRAGKNNPQALRTLEYFDPYQLAPRLHIPVLMSAGGKDHTCPKATIESVYNRIPDKRKKLVVYPKLVHTTCLDFYQQIWPWLDRYLDLGAQKRPCG